MSKRTFEELYAVVVNWNGGAEDNRRCLASLEAQGLRRSRIVVVDNGSDDGSREVIDAEFPGLLRIDNAENLGFGEAANQGARLAVERGAAAVIFVNNDLRFPEDEPVLSGLCGALDDDENLAAVGPRVLHDDGSDRIWCAGGRLDYRQNLSTLLGFGEPDDPRWQRDADVDYIVGCAAMVRREVIESVGLFEASYFAYMEDVELGLRMRNAGWGVRTIGRLRAFHAPSSATGGGYGARRKWMQALNSVRFLKTHGKSIHWLRFMVFDVLTLPPLILVRAIRGDVRPGLAKARGLWDGILGRRVTARALEPGASRLWPS